MITESTRGENLFHEVHRDYEDTISKELKKRRDTFRKPYVKKRQDIKELEWIRFSMMTPKYNTWFITSGIVGRFDRPKAINMYHCSSNSGPGGSKVCYIYRGNKTARMQEKGKGGYVVSVMPHVFTKMRERNQAFSDIKDNDALCEKIFTMEEEGIYYDFDWRKYKRSHEADSMPISIPPREEEDSWVLKKVEVKTIPVILKTLAGLFLGLVTEDRAEIRLVTYLTLDQIEDPEEKEMIENFLIPAWTRYNFSMFDRKYVDEVWEKLNAYMEGKENRTVYRLTI